MDQPLKPTLNRDDFTNVASALSWQARQQPDAVAIHYPRSRLFRKPIYESCTYRELDKLSDDYARGLAAYGIGPGTRTALMVTPGLDFFALFFARIYWALAESPAKLLGLFNQDRLRRNGAEV